VLTSHGLKLPYLISDSVAWIRCSERVYLSYTSKHLLTRVQKNKL